MGEIVLAMAIPFVLIRGYHTLLDSRAGTFVEEPTRTDPGWMALVDVTEVVGIAEVDRGAVTGVALLVVNQGSDTLSLVDPLSLAETDRIPVGDQPGYVLVDETGRQAYVLNERSDSVSVVDLAVKALAASVATESEPTRGQLNRRGDRLYGERVATNTPIQGSAADLCKLAMVAIARQFAERGLDTRLVLQIHDELVFEAPRDEVDTVCAIVRREMEEVLPLAVPLAVDVGVGDNWGEAHG